MHHPIFDPLAEGCACTTLRKASRAVSRIYDDALSAVGLTTPQFAILRHLERHGPLALSRLADALVMDRTSLYRMLTPMTRCAWLEITPGTRGTAKIARVTDAGRNALAAAHDGWEQAQAQIVGRLGQEAWRGLEAALRDVTRDRHKSGAARMSMALRASRTPYIVVAVTFLALLVSAGLRSAPGVLMVPLTVHFGWDRATISFSAAIGILLYGLVGPFAAALMLSIGIRRTMLGGLALMSAVTFASLWMTQPWHYVLSWGVFSGIGSGAVASVLGAAVVNRWFATRQGLVMGMLSASTATGALVFLPLLAWLASAGAWRGVVLAVSIGCLCLIPLVLFLVPEHPADAGTRRFGETAASAAPPAMKQAATPWLAFEALFRATKVRMFWLLFGTFFVCGLTTNGLVGTHMIAFCGDHGIAPVAAAGLLSMMGFFDLFGTTASGWLTDRYDPKRLLFVYYALRGLSLIVLPFLDFGAGSLTVFAMFYGLDWIATVPPTVKLANLAFGERDAPIVFGWIMVGHQLGAATAAFGAGLIRQQTGSYLPAFVIAGALAVVAALVLVAPGLAMPRRAQPA